MLSVCASCRCGPTTPINHNLTRLSLLRSLMFYHHPRDIQLQRPPRQRALLRRPVDGLVCGVSALSRDGRRRLARHVAEWVQQHSCFGYRLVNGHRAVRQSWRRRPVQGPLDLSPSRVLFVLCVSFGAFCRRSVLCFQIHWFWQLKPRPPYPPAMKVSFSGVR